ncbi:MAG TPA: zf-HC2 domain-containing protein [Steroidobacter sp.]|jgi:anti-sigma factor RsiW|nr:zf-HC2 domain-containing protein [Steroidobacter sp.]
MSYNLEHALLWSDRLQDWLDGNEEAAERAAVEAHLADCEQCRAQLAEFQELDAALQSTAKPIALTEAFEARLFARVDVIDEAQRAAARERAEQEWRDSLSALSRNWRRTLAFVIPGVIGGIVLAFALTSYFVASDMGEPLLESAQTLGRLDTHFIQSLLTTVFGAAVGAGVARWLASVAE